MNLYSKYCYKRFTTFLIFNMGRSYKYFMVSYNHEVLHRKIYFLHYFHLKKIVVFFNIVSWLIGYVMCVSYQLDYISKLGPILSLNKLYLVLIDTYNIHLCVYNLLFVMAYWLFCYNNICSEWLFSWQMLERVFWGTIK